MAPDIAVPNQGELSIETLHNRLMTTHSVETEWRSRTAHLTLYTPLPPRSQPRLVVKRALDGSDTGNAECLYTALQACRSYAESRNQTHFVGQPYWWGSSPDYVCVEWVEGTSLRDLIVQKAQADDENFHTWMVETASTIGRLLASYHSSFSFEVQAMKKSQPPPVENDPGRAERIARLVGRRATAAEVIVRSLGDSGPHNIIVDPEGQVWLIDLPDTGTYRAAQWDIARVALQLLRPAESTRYSSWLPGLPLQAKLLDALVSGYSMKGPSGAITNSSLTLIHAYQASESFVKSRKELNRRPRRFKVASREMWRGLRSASIALRDRK